MKSMFSKLPLSLQFNIAITISIILLTLVAGFVSIKLSSNALLHTQHLGLEKKIATTAELLSTPYQSLTPIVGTMANKLRLTFSGELSLTANERVNINGESVTVMKLNGQAITKDFTLVDQFTKDSQAPATIFQRVGDDFLRVSTSLKKQNGDRAFGTWLGKKHPGYQQLLNGQPYQGYAKLFGKHFITQYEPVLIKGKVAAILFVGVDVSNSVQQAFDTIAKVKIGDTGYIYIIDGKGNMVLHPSIPIGTPFLNQTTKDGQRPFVDMTKTKSGTLRYLWQHKNGEYKEKYTRYEYAQDWDWIIVGGTYEEEFTQAANNMVGTLATTYILGTLIVVFVGVFTAKRLLQPLQNLEVKVAAVGQGELVKHGLTNYPTASQNEVHKIENSMHAMVTSLRQLVNDAAEIGNKVNTISESVCQHAQGQQSTAIELNSASEQGATAIEEMSVSFREVAQSVTNTSDSARIVEQSTAETSSYMSTLLQSTAQMTTRINQVDDAIGDLSSNAANIQQAVELIRGVAEQTNLLALNAAIEAARAGEQGRGFAVVADEVRSLAQRTKRSTNEIEQVVEQFFVATEKAKHSMSLTLEETKVTNSKVNESNSLLNNVSNMVYNINNELDTISTAVTEQSAVSDDIAKRQNEVNQVAHSAAQQADQILHSASELSQLADDLSHSLAKFSA